MGRLHWSLLDIMWQLHLGGLHGDLIGISLLFLVFGVPYVVFLLFLGSACISPSVTLLLPVWTIGVISASVTFRSFPELERMFYGTCCSPPIGVEQRELSWVLVIIMLVLALVVVYQPRPEQ
jgi:hypothetical protein